MGCGRGFDGEGPAFGEEDGGIVEEFGDWFGVEGCGHDEEFEVGADGLLDLAEEGDGEIGVEVAFVEFVEDDRNQWCRGRGHQGGCG